MKLSIFATQILFVTSCNFLTQGASHLQFTIPYLRFTIVFLCACRGITLATPGPRWLSKISDLFLADFFLSRYYTQNRQSHIIIFGIYI